MQISRFFNSCLARVRGELLMRLRHVDQLLTVITQQLDSVSNFHVHVWTTADLTLFHLGRISLRLSSAVSAVPSGKPVCFARVRILCFLLLSRSQDSLITGLLHRDNMCSCHEEDGVDYPRAPSAEAEREKDLQELM